LFAEQNNQSIQELEMDLKLQALRQEVKRYRKKSARVTSRLLALIELTKFRHKHGQLGESDYERLAGRLEISARTLYRWEAAYRCGGVRALEPKKAPGRKPNPIRGHVARWVRYYRLRYRWGAEVIHAHLSRDHDIEVGIDRLKRYLRRPELRLRKRIKLARKNAHTRVVQVEHPGAHTQTDVKHLPHLLPNGQKCYVYNFVDHASRWSFKRAYDSYGPGETRDFMSAVIQAAPFTITRSQTDNGVEFTNKYLSHTDEPKTHALDDLYASHGIRHVLIPPGEKELQGLVERSHRQDDDELFHRIQPATLVEFNQLLAEHCEWRNACRRRKALDWKTAGEFLADYTKRVQAWLYAGASSPFQIQTKAQGADETKNLGQKAA
jgi:transposase